jgi:hypothetical protein
VTLDQAGDAILDIQLSKKMIEYNYAQIEFRPKGPLLSPKEMGISDDGRKLSLGLVSLFFR